MDEIPITETNRVVLLLINSNRAKRAIKTKRTKGLEKVNAKELKKSPTSVCLTGSFGFGCVDGFVL